MKKVKKLSQTEILQAELSVVKNDRDYYKSKFNEVEKLFESGRSSMYCESTIIVKEIISLKEVCASYRAKYECLSQENHQLIQLLRLKSGDKNAFTHNLNPVNTYGH